MSPQVPPDIYSVSALFAELKDILQKNYPQEVRVSGELSEFTSAGSGHWYFSLKDEKTQLRCVMFRSANTKVSFLPQKGFLLTLTGRPSFYETRGEFQLIVHQMVVGGQGDLQRRYEALRDRLLKEGLFAKERKKPVPRFITRLGLITSESGAVLHDVLKVLARRMPMMKITFFPVAVQGEGAALKMIAALAAANRRKDLDAVLITRGGGSMEDLWCFNNEELVRMIAASSLPVVTAIGHEVDYTLADFAAAKRAATPSAAAEELSVDGAGLAADLGGQTARMKRAIEGRIQNNMQQCDLLQNRLRGSNPLTDHAERLRNLSHGLRELMRYYQSDARQRLAAWQERLFAVSPHKQQRQRVVQLKEASLRLHIMIRSLVKDHQERLVGYDRVLRMRRKDSISTAAQRLQKWEGMIRALSPQLVLERGYSLVSNKRGELVRDVGDLHLRERLQVRFARGRVDAQVQGIYDKEQQDSDKEQQGLNFAED